MRRGEKRRGVTRGTARGWEEEESERGVNMRETRWGKGEGRGQWRGKECGQV